MDEALAPILGSLRAIRRSISSSVFNPIQSGGASQAPQVDPATTNLISQNALTLNLVSQRLDNISQQMRGLNSSLSGIKENLAVSDTIEKRREAAKQNRERILAEQGLREGKEDALEKNIQTSLQKPVAILAGKTSGSLNRLSTFFTFLVGGWLTKTTIDLLRARATGNTDKFERLKTNLTRGLVAIGATLTAISLGVGRNIVFGLSRLGVTLTRASLGGLLFVKIELLRQALVGLFKSRFPSTFKFATNLTTAIVASIALLGDRIIRTISSYTTGVATAFYDNLTKALKNIKLPKFGFGGAPFLKRFSSFLKFGQVAVLPFFGELFLALQVRGENLVEAFVNSTRLAASFAAADKFLKRFGGRPQSKIGQVFYFAGLSIIATSFNESTRDISNAILRELGIEVTEDEPPARAMGGPVNKGVSYLVGERGPELFTPDEDGKIIANNMIEALKVDQTNLREAIALASEDNLPPNILSFPIQSNNNGNGSVNAPPSQKMLSNTLPQILFNEANIHLVHATSLYGVNV